jgi:hypothetical protein
MQKPSRRELPRHFQCDFSDFLEQNVGKEQLRCHRTRNWLHKTHAKGCYHRHDWFGERGSVWPWFGRGHRFPFRGSPSSFLLKFALLDENELLTNEPGNRVQASVSAPLSGLVDLCGPQESSFAASTTGPRPFRPLACQAVCWSRCASHCISFP